MAAGHCKSLLLVAFLLSAGASSESLGQAVGEYFQVVGVPVPNLAAADAVVDSTAPSATANVSQIDYVDNFYDPPFGGGGRFPLGVLFPGVLPIQQDSTGDNFVFRVRGALQVPASGIYSFGSTSDDGVRLSIDGATVLEHEGFPFEAFSTVDLSAGTHLFEILLAASVFADSLEVYSQPGSFSSFNDGFRLVGDYENGGLRIVPEPWSLAMIGVGLLCLVSCRRR